MRRYLRKAVAVAFSSAMAISLLWGCGKDNSKDINDGTEKENVNEKINFIKGVDISSIIAQEKSGVTYYNKEGKEQDIFKTFSAAGVNYVRVRVWNDPYDKNGMGYGGGNCDVENAAEIGKRANEYNMRLCVDFHYSDFWADPEKQIAPKEWKDYSLEEKKKAVYEYTKESLKTISDAGSDIGMVQIGNEINNGIAGENDIKNVMEILKSASNAVREFSKSENKDIKVVVHYTDVHKKEGIMYYARTLRDSGVDYDVFGVSYYPYWHGTMTNLTDVLKNVKEQYGKETIVLETSYMYTVLDGDGFSNNASGKDVVKGYSATVEGQGKCIKDIMAAAKAAEALGIFYWEPAWIPVGNNRDKNTDIWEKNGSGWASSYAKEYDPNNAGEYYGGSSWDNQALFDFSGKPLSSLDAFLEEID